MTQAGVKSGEGDDTMALIPRNPGTLFPPYRSYSHAIEAPAGARLLFISGLNGYQADGRTMPDSFEAQGELVWQYIGDLLHESAMDDSDRVSIRTYLSDPICGEANVGLRLKYLGSHRPA